MAANVHHEIAGIRMRLSSPGRVRELSSGEVKSLKPLTTERSAPKRTDSSASVYLVQQRAMSAPAVNISAVVLSFAGLYAIAAA